MKNLTTGNIYKNFILFAIPLVLSGFLSQSFTIINTILSGKYLGDIGLAASGATSGFFNFYGAIFWGYGMGFSICIAKLFGEKNYLKIKSSIYNNSLLLFVVMLIAGIIMAIFRNPIFDALKVDPAIREDAIKYFVVLVIPYFFAIFRVWGVLILNSFGMSSFPFWISLASSVVGTVLKVIALAVFKTGIVSLAVITHFVSLLVCVCYIIRIEKCFKEMGVLKEKVSFDKESIKETASLAVPTTFQQMVMAVVSLLISPLVNAIGSSASAAYSVVVNIQGISNQVYQNSSKTVSNYSAQCVGARKFHNLSKGVRVGLLQGFVLLTPVLIVCVLFAEPICKMYFPEGYTGDSLQHSILFMRVYLPFIVFNVINNLFHAFYRGVMAMKILITATLAGAVTRIIPTMLLVPRFGMEGVYMGWAISWAAEAVFTSVIYFTGVWKKEKINKIIAEEGLKV